jgi:hypothetical protein
MPPKAKSTASMFKSVIRTREKNKTAHPGEPDQAAKRRTHTEMEEVRSKQIADKKSEDDRQKAALTKAAQVEDALRQEDIDRQKSADQPKPLTQAFRPEVAVDFQG